jgi:hypothetical protein
MGAKKRADGGKQVTDDSAEQLYRAYRRYLNDMSILMPKQLEEKFLEIRDEKNPGFLTELVFWDVLEPEGLRALADALRDTTYTHLKSIRLWGSKTRDEGTRSLCQYMRVSPSILILEMIQCELTSLSCEFLGRLLSPSNSSPLLTLRLDHNDLGNQGIIQLSEGLSMNSVLKTLTLSYCNFDSHACRAIMQILIFHETALQELDVQGNKIAVEGCSDIFRALKINQVLNKLNIADTALEGDENFVDRFIEMLTVNTSLYSVDLRLNLILDDCAKDVLDRMKHASTGRINSVLYEIIFPEGKVQEETLEEIQKFLLPNKKGKKGKKKSKKSKK